MTKEEKRKKRRKRTAEIFTPKKLVDEMLDKLPEEVWQEGKTFCDPACGDGEFLIQVLLRKLHKGHDPLESLKSIYGCDIMKDNIEECRKRLLKTISSIKPDLPITEDHVIAIFINIRFLSTKRYPKGSLDYDFEFKENINKRTLKKWTDWLTVANNN